MAFSFFSFISDMKVICWKWTWRVLTVCFCLHQVYHLMVTAAVSTCQDGQVEKACPWAETSQPVNLGRSTLPYWPSADISWQLWWRRKHTVETVMFGTKYPCAWYKRKSPRLCPSASVPQVSPSKTISMFAHPSVSFLSFTHCDLLWLVWPSQMYPAYVLHIIKQYLTHCIWF